MANQEKTLSTLLCHYSFLLLWRFLRTISISAAWLFYKWGVRNDFLITDYRPLEGLQTTFWGQRLKTPVGVSAEIDRTGVILDSLIQMGYGFGEFGTYTLDKEDPVNRTHYFAKDLAICTEQRGFKNQGVSNAVSLLSVRRRLPHFTGVSITTTAESEMSNLKQGAVMTYPMEFELMTQKVAPYCDYIVANLTLPGTDLTERIYDETSVVPVLQKIKETAKIAAPIATPKIALKMPVDLADIEIPMVVKSCQRAGVDALIIGGPLNLSKHRKVPVSQKLPMIPFNILTGAPMKRHVLAMIRRMRKETNGQIPIIACGGVFSGQDVYDYLAAGASLVQVHAALYFNGPFAFKKIHRELAQLMKKNGFADVASLIGSEKDDAE